VADLVAIAAAIPIPVEAGRRCRAYVGVEHGGGKTIYRAYFALDQGLRRSEYVGPEFTKPSKAARFAALLNQEPEAT
jgi:hypothetical protein